MIARSRGDTAPHVELMLSLARLQLQPDDVRRANRALRQGLDWDELVSLSSTHGVLPLLHRHLANAAWPARPIPVAAAATFRAMAERIAQRGLFLADELAALLRVFDEHQLRVVPLKGPILARQLYGSPAMRPVNDIDLLVAEGDVPRVSELLAERGYGPLMGRREADAGSAHRMGMDHVSFVAKAATHRVEVHYSLHAPLGRRRLGIDTISDALESVSFLGAPALVMEPARLLVYLCMHGDGRAWERLEWACGVAELLRSGQAGDWDRVAAHARSVGGDRKLRAGLLVAHHLLDAPMPAPFVKPDALTRGAARTVVRRLTRDPARRPTVFARVMYQLRTDRGVADRATRLWTALAMH